MPGSARWKQERIGPSDNPQQSEVRPCPLLDGYPCPGRLMRFLAADVTLFDLQAHRCHVPSCLPLLTRDYQQTQHPSVNDFRYVVVGGYTRPGRGSGVERDSLHSARAHSPWTKVPSPIPHRIVDAASMDSGHRGLALFAVVDHDPHRRRGRGCTRAGVSHLGYFNPASVSSRSPWIIFSASLYPVWVLVAFQTPARSTGRLALA